MCVYRFHITYKITNILCVCPFTSPTFLTNSCVLEKNRTRVDRV